MRTRISSGFAVTYARRTASCSACGLRLHKVRTFRQALAGDGPDAGSAAASVLHAQVRAWMSEPVVCGRCPGRVTAEAAG